VRHIFEKLNVSAGFMNLFSEKHINSHFYRPFITTVQAPIQAPSSMPNPGFPGRLIIPLFFWYNNQMPYKLGEGTDGRYKKAGYYF
jgi:hypothetical protein